MRAVPRRYPLCGAIEALLLTLFSLFLVRSNWSGALAYEFSFFLAIGVALLSTAATSIRLSKIQSMRPIDRSDLGCAIAANQIQLLSPLSVVLAASIAIPTCRYDVGAVWFLLHPMISAFFGTACAIWAYRVSRSPLKAFGWAFLPMILFSILTLFDFATSPMLTFLHPAFGFFSGPIYDEWIPIRSAIVTYRVWVLLLSLALILEPNWKGFRRVMVSILLALFLMLRIPLGWHQSRGSLENHLYHHSRYDHFTLFSDSTFSSSQLNDWYQLLSFRWIEITRELEIPNPRPLSVYLYSSEDQKEMLTGVRNTAIGNPMQHALHLPSGIDPRSTIVKHELTHVLAAPYGIPGLGISLRVGLMEGLATAMERYRGELSVHEWAASMKRLGLLPDLRYVLDPVGFWREPPSRAYLAAGSFSRWWMDRYGVTSLLSLYRGNLHAKTALESQIQNWEAWLDHIPLSSEALDIAEPSLRAEAIFDRRCPHDVADALENAQRCQAERNWKEAQHFFSSAKDYAGAAPNVTLSLARNLVHLSDWKALELESKVLREEAKTSSFYQAWASMLEGDAHFFQSDPEGADRIYRSVDLHRLPFQLRFAIAARKFLIQERKQLEFNNMIRKGVLPPLLRIEILRSLGWVPERLEAEARFAEEKGDFQQALEKFSILRDEAGTEGKRFFAEDQIHRLVMFHPDSEKE